MHSFPATITNSASMMLMPSVAEMQALGYRKRIRYVTWQTIVQRFLCAFGFTASVVMGTVLFHSPTAGTYIQTLSFVCPFLYLDTTLTVSCMGLVRQDEVLYTVLWGSCPDPFVVFAIPLPESAVIYMESFSARFFPAAFIFMHLCIIPLHYLSTVLNRL